jgi:fructoselysine 6-kinase
MKIVCAGDCGVDRYVELGAERPGGITLNVAVHARRLFAPDDEVTVLTALGDDAEAALVATAIERAGLDACITRLPGATPVQYIGIESSGEKRFLRYEEGVLRDYRMAERECNRIRQADVLVTTVFAQAEGLFESVIACPSAGVRAVDFTDLADFADPVSFVRAHVDRLTVGFFGLRLEQTALIDALDALAREHDRLFVVTLAEHGSLALGRAGRTSCPALPVQRVVDTTGAGDAFTAGFLSEYARTADVAASLARGAEAAARTIQHVGAFEL